MRRPQLESGFALLEHAFAFISILLVVSAAVDITKFLQAYQALQAGVQSSLRKCYVTDGGCLTPKEMESISLFKVWQKPIQGFEQDYSADGWYLKLPDVQYRNPSARILDTVESTYARVKGSLFLNTYPVSGQIYYGLQISELPGLTSFDFRQSPHFTGSPLKQLNIGACTIRNGSGGRVESVTDISGSTSSTTATRIGSISCRIEAPVKSDAALYKRCVKAYGNHAACDETWKSGTRIALAIEGEGHGRDAPSGKVSMTISQNGNTSMKGDSQQEDCAGSVCDYGGRIFTGWGAFNFVPRGIPLSSLGESLRGGGSYSEFKKHDYIWVRYGEDFKISLKLNRLEGGENGTVAWNASAVKIYYIDYDAKNETAACSSGMRRSDIKEGALCTPALPGREYLKPLTAASLKGDFSRPQKTLKSEACIDPVAGTSDPKANLCTKIGDSEKCVLDYEYISASNQELCGTYRRISPCPENYGIAAKGLEEKDPSTGRYFVRDLPEAAAVCPLDKSSLRPDAWSLSTLWYEKDIALPPIAQTFTALDCTMIQGPFPGPLPSPHDKYRNFYAGSPTVTGYTKRGLGADADPRKEKLNDSRYACGEVTAGSDPYRALSLPDYGCDWAVADKAIIKNAMNIPPGYFFEAGEKRTSEAQTGEIWYSSPAALDSCTEYVIRDEADLSDKRSYLGLYTEGSTPSSCTPVDPKDPAKKESPADMWCLFRSEGSVNTGGGGFETGDISTASGTGINAIRTLFPAARFDCPERTPYCVKFRPPTPHLVNGMQVFQASASIRVPMNLLFGSDIPIHIADSRTWEGEFAR